MRHTLLLVLLLLALAPGCKQSQPAQESATQSPSAQVPQASPAAGNTSQQPAEVQQPEKAQTDACALLTSEEIQSVQGEPVKETKLSGRSDGGFSVSQCFFTLPTFTNSISLAVTQKAGNTQARDPKEFWKETFHKDSAEVKREREKERERERENDREREREGEEEEEEVEPERVRGIGDEAYWMGSRVGGALYVLKGNSYLRLSIGGAGDQASRIKKLKALAQKAIVRL